MASLPSCESASRHRLKSSVGSGLRDSLLLAILLGFCGGTVSGQGFSPGDAEKRLKTRQGLSVTLFAAEPLVRQPIFVKCDPRGRLWTIQYLQYPNPAGLTRVAVDRWSRTTYDRVPEPPPHGPRGADLISILEDGDGDGRADRSKTVIEGLNLCTGLEFGHGGLFVLQAPYLLFYPDSDRNDVPDADPEVLLTGFGIEDAQSMVNHLTWGPDGWLYGVTGSTSTNRIGAIEFQQGVWRYHPRSRKFELFCEGGSNLFGLTFDAAGQMFFTSNGGQLCYHGVQGAYYAKSFGKHGGLHHPYAYGWWEEIAKRQPQRGGPTTGGTVYLGGAIPGLEGAFIGGDFLGHTVSSWSLSSRGGTFEADRTGTILDPQDTWSGPTDVTFGPAGEIYVSDFYDRRTAHPDPDAEWDRSNGRIYRIAAERSAPAEDVDFPSLTAPRLVSELDHANHWRRRQARLELAARRDPAALPLLVERLSSPRAQVVLEAFWTLSSTGQLDAPATLELFHHQSPDVRFWAVRLAGDEFPANQALESRLVELARHEASTLVLTQILATARRLDRQASTAVVRELVSRELPDFERLKWPLWWAAEAHSVQGCPEWADSAWQREAWGTVQGRFLIPLLARRFAAEGTSRTYAAVAKILESTPGEDRAVLLKAIDQGLGERNRKPAAPAQGELFTASAAPQADTRRPQELLQVDGPLRAALQSAWDDAPGEPVCASLALRAGLKGAAITIAHRAADARQPLPTRLALLQTLEQSRDSEIVEILLASLRDANDASIAAATLERVAQFDQPGVAERCLELLKHAEARIRSTARRVLLSRPGWARMLFDEVAAGRVSPADVPVEELREVALHQDEGLNQLVRRYWGAVQAGTPEVKLAEMRRLNNDLRAETGDPVLGRALFKTHCANCHKLFGEGEVVGPDLTTTSRADREFLLRSLIDPSAVIRSQYLSSVVATTEGQVLTGLVASRDNGQIVLVDSKAQRKSIPTDLIESIKDSNVSLMPEGLISKLKPEEVRALFAYLQSQGNDP